MATCRESIFYVSIKGVVGEILKRVLEEKQEKKQPWSVWQWAVPVAAASRCSSLCERGEKGVPGIAMKARLLEIP